MTRNKLNLFASVVTWASTALCVWAPLALCSLSLACGVESEPASSGGIDADVEGFAVVNSDYQSVSISLTNLDGEVLSEHFIASGSADTGLSAALGFGMLDFCNCKDWLWT